MAKYANVIVDISLDKLDKTFQYIIPEELEQLAQKARFSQHKLTDGELRQFVEYADLLTQTLLKEAKPLRRAVYRLVYVLQ